MRKLICLLTLLILAATASWAQPPTSPFKTISLDISVFDKFQRPYVADPENISLGVRLAQGESQSSKAVADHEHLSEGALEYARQSDEYIKFPVEGGIAHAKFVVFNEESKNPVKYELVLFVKEKKDSSPEKIPLNPSMWDIGLSAQSGDVAADHRAPHSRSELLAIAAFTLVGMALGYYLFGRVYFRRLLHNNRQEVTNALGWSNVFVMVTWLVLFVCTAVLVFFPYVWWQKTYWVYVVVMGGYAAFILLTYGFAAGTSRR